MALNMFQRFIRRDVRSCSRFCSNSTLGAVCALLFLSVATTPLRASIILNSVSNRSLTVGDRIKFTVTVIVPKGATVTPPDLESALGTIVVKEWNLKRVERERSDSLLFEYILTTYHPENCTIPSLSYVQSDSKGTDTLRTQPIELQVLSVIDTDSADIRDIKPPLAAGNAPLWWLWILLTAVAAITGLLVSKKLIARFRKVAPPPPPKPPYEEAIAALRELEARGYLAKGMVREYVFELSEILKRYIERRFGVNAAEFTTEEIVGWLGASDLDKKLRHSVEWFFRTSDPIKFARFIPDSKTLERFGTEIRSFLEATKPSMQEIQPAVATSETVGKSSESPELQAAAISQSGAGTSALEEK